MYSKLHVAVNTTYNPEYSTRGRPELCHLCISTYASVSTSYRPTYNFQQLKRGLEIPRSGHKASIYYGVNCFSIPRTTFIYSSLCSASAAICRQISRISEDLWLLRGFCRSGMHLAVNAPTDKMDKIWANIRAKTL